MTNQGPFDNGPFLAALAAAWEGHGSVDRDTMRALRPPLVTLEMLAIVSFKVSGIVH